MDPRLRGDDANFMELRLIREVKICGLRDAVSVAAAVEDGARYVGFNFYLKSPRVVGAQTAAALIEILPSSVVSVGLFVDPSDEEIRRVLGVAPLRMIQLHGGESSERVAAVRALTALPVIKAVGIATPQDVEAARRYEDVADFLLLDAKLSGTFGGSGVTFDWSLLKNAAFAKPWLLAGGLNISNVAAAVAATGARILDVSSGVEESAGRKSPEKIREFLKTVRNLETCC
ncbi:MAG: phosphoribosylanthranilate isomerase [Alphaproteobacteria bacterium]|nr:phosphoribosylanthranilate isomerase [Alphaproteobacteria bacterium]